MTTDTPVGQLVVPLVDEGLGNSAYLVDLGDGRALAVDASRDLRAVRALAAQRSLTVAYAADTHLHADFLSGAVQLGAEGATVLASAAGDREFPHVALADGDEVDLGGLRLRAMSTPGHTHEHLAFELLDGSRVLGVFTGGSLIVGSAARTDLVAPERTEALARAQYQSLHRLAALDDDVEVWPTHGAGSFCSPPAGSARTSTIGRERVTNSLLQAPTEDAFVAQLLAGLGSFPTYFRRLGELNRLGAALVPEGAGLPPLSAPEVLSLRRSGAEVVDVRPVGDFAEAHVLGSLSIQLRPVFATWLGWLVPADRPVVVVRNEDQDPDEILWQARKIGHDHVVGELAGGVAAWRAAGGSTGSIPLLGPADLGSGRLLDVRQDREYAAGHVPGAAHVELGSLPGRLDDLTLEPTAVMCGHFERAMTGASVLERSGRRDLSVLRGGPQDWADAHHRAVEVGS